MIGIGTTEKGFYSGESIRFNSKYSAHKWALRTKAHGGGQWREK